jgi:hypothetical protein
MSSRPTQANLGRPYLKNKRVEGIAQVIENKHEALGSSPTTTKK